jgi:TRAP-type mannitol/chloroaromatic compound transport system substrate-binding protein
MKKKALTVFLAIMLVLLLVAAGCAPAAAPAPEPVPPADPPAPVAAPAEVHEWVAVGIHTPGEAAHAFEQELVQIIEEATGGRIQIELHPIGALVPPMETFDAVATGAVDLSLKTSMWWGGKEPAMVLLTSLPGSFTHWYQLDFWYWRHGGIDLAREAFAKHNIYFVGPAAFGTPPFGAEMVMSRVPIRSIDDYKGLKVRSGGAAAKWFEAVGASVVSIPGPEISAALEKGVVDAAEWVGPTLNWGLGLHELAAKQYSRMRAMHHEALDHEHLQKMKDFGVEIIQWTPEEIARGQEVARGIWEGFAVDDLSRRVLESQMAYMRLIGLIE